MGKSVRLDSHPNYKPPTPDENDTLISFTLRWIAHLVSPPQLPGESDENECVEIAAQILELECQIQEAWDRYHKFGFYAVTQGGQK